MNTLSDVVQVVTSLLLSKAFVGNHECTEEW